VALIVSTDFARLDLQLIHDQLAASYWAKGIPRETLERSLRGSLCFGAYLPAEEGKAPEGRALEGKAPEGRALEGKAPEGRALEGKAIAAEAPRERDRQIGFARVVTDRATFAYLADVFVVPELRGKGVGRALLDCITAHPDLQGLRRWLLATRDAHGLYAKYGFAALGAPERMMELLDAEVYLRARPG